MPPTWPVGDMLRAMGRRLPPGCPCRPASAEIALHTAMAFNVMQLT